MLKRTTGNTLFDFPFILTEAYYTDIVEPGGIYKYTVAYGYQDGNSWSSGPASPYVLCGTLPFAPQRLTATLTAYEFELSWEGVDNAEGYIVYRRDDPQGSFNEILRTEGTNIITITPPDGTTYCYRVSAFNQWGEGETSSDLSVRGRSNLSLRAPTGFCAIPTDDTNVFSLTWDPVPGADRYYIFRDKENMGYTRIGPVPAQLYSTGDLLFDTTYEYWVQAANETVYGRSSDTLALSIPPSANSSLLAPNDLKGIRMGSSSIKLSWDNVAGAEKYQIFEYDRQVATATNCTCTIEGLLPEQFYAFKVRAMDTHNAAGLFSDWVSIKTDKGFPAPTWASLGISENGSVELRWISHNYFFIGYDIYKAQRAFIYRREERSNAYVKKFTVDLSEDLYDEECTVQDDDVQPGKRYYYTIRTYSDQVGEGYPSTERNVKIPLIAPTGLRASVLTTNRIRLDWNAVEDARSYKIILPIISGTGEQVTREVTDPFYVFNFSDNIGNSPMFGVSYSDADNDISPSSWITVPINLDAPEGVTAMALDSSRVQLRWNRVEGAESYNVYRSRMPTGEFVLVGHITTDTGLNANTLYFYKIAAVNGAGPGDLSSMASVRTGIAVPQNLVAASVSSSKIFLSWNAVSGAEAYDVYRSDTSDGIHGVIKRVTGTSTSDEGLLPNTRHSYTVAAVIRGMPGEASAPASARTRVAAPQGLNAIALNSSSIRLSCLAVEGAESYNVYRTTFAGKAYRLIGQNMTDTGLEADTVYYYKIAGVNREGPGDLSSAVSIRTGIAAPQNLVAESLSQSKIGLAWCEVLGAEAYDVYRSDTTDGIHGVIKRVTGTSTTDEGLLPNTHHSYKVAAVIEGRVGEASTAAVASTRVAAPKGLTAVAVGSDSIQLAWEAVDGALNYIVYRSLNLKEEFEPVGDLTSTVFTDTGLKRGAIYYYYIKAGNKWGEGSKSDQASAFTGK
jgi:fibronectin type 3 domain-containing protein